MNVQQTDNTRELYEKFRLQWMLDHGHTLPELIDELQKLHEESDPNIALQTIFKDWEFGYGFGSEIWPCYEEFLDSEYWEAKSHTHHGKERRGASRDASR